MVKLTPLPPGHRQLRTKPKPITKSELRSKSHQNKIEDLLEYVKRRSNKGPKRSSKKATIVGLSANQVGINKRICVVDLAIASKTFSDLHILINPRILTKSQQTADYSEGCVNLINVRGFVKRYKSVTVAALDRSGNKLQFQLNGWPAVLLQHEIDHLNGKLFIDHLADPTRAHLVKPADHQKHKKVGKSWDKFIDVSQLIG